MTDIFLKSLEPELVPDTLRFFQNSLIKILKPKIGIFALFVLEIEIFMMQFVNNSSTMKNIEI
jgi:hypothetical protein